jgi:hypothetical protein
MTAFYKPGPDLLVAVVILAGLALFGLIFGDGIDRWAIGLAVVFGLAKAGGVQEALKLRSERRRR